MTFLGLVIKTIGSIVAFVIAVKLIAVILGILGLVLKLLWLAVWVGLFLLVAWALYKIFSPRQARPI
ncbi:MAG: hypothetical protein HY231_02815 [Acidobacteria bacterium]|nr:hypothetical protein [Acidobacteriota bacterium]